MTEQNQTQEQPRVHGNTRKAADMDLAKKAISPDSHRAVHEGRITLDEARELGREGSPFGPAKKPVSKSDRTRLCMCGCQRETKGRFAMGHDGRVKGWIVRAVREDNPKLEGFSAEIREYAAERDLIRQTEQRMADEEQKKAEKQKAKAAKREGNDG